MSDRSSADESRELDLERDIPTTDEDIRVLASLRRRTVGVNLLPQIDELFRSLELEKLPPRRTTAEGWEPFEL